eukprot:1322487-Amorphochlora_amoeboformis.AAC.1
MSLVVVEKGGESDEQKETKDNWILVEAPSIVEYEFQVVSMGEVKSAVNEFIVQVRVFSPKRLPHFFSSFSGVLKSCVLQCFTSDIANNPEFKNLDDRSLKGSLLLMSIQTTDPSSEIFRTSEIIDKAVVNMKPESRMTQLYHYSKEAYTYGKSAYKLYTYAAFAFGLASKPILMRLIAECKSFPHFLSHLIDSSLKLAYVPIRFHGLNGDSLPINARNAVLVHPKAVISHENTHTNPPSQLSGLFAGADFQINTTERCKVERCTEKRGERIEKEIRMKKKYENCDALAVIIQ